MNSIKLFNTGKRGFASLYNYSSKENPRVFMTVAAGEKKVGDLVFELYADAQPQTSESFRVLCDGSEANSYVGTTFHQGMTGFGISGGRIGEENLGAFGVRLQDEDLTMRHHKRGMLTVPNQGENAAGSEFTVTFGAAGYLDGYQTVFGELVDGQKVLEAMEAACDRHGNLKEDFTIVATGQK